MGIEAVIIPGSRKRMSTKRDDIATPIALLFAILATILSTLPQSRMDQHDYDRTHDFFSLYAPVPDLSPIRLYAFRIAIDLPSVPWKDCEQISILLNKSLVKTFWNTVNSTEGARVLLFRLNIDPLNLSSVS